jgi:hypothetical protein
LLFVFALSEPAIHGAYHIQTVNFFDFLRPFHPSLLNELLLIYVMRSTAVYFLDFCFLEGETSFLNQI